MLFKFPMVQFCLSFFCGIVMAHQFQPKLCNVLWVSLSLVGIVSVYWWIARKKIIKTAFFGILTLFTFISFGILFYQSYHRLPEQHFSHSNFKSSSDVFFQFKVLERLKSNTYNDRYIVSILQINDSITTGKLLFHLKKEDNLLPLQIDAIGMASAKITPIKEPLNPHQFDFSNYMALQNIHYQSYTENQKLLLISNTTKSIYGIADTWRQTIVQKLKQSGFSNDAVGIISALLLGQRQDINPDIYNNFVNSGTVHILAVSGLHVGLILLIIIGVLRPLLGFKYGKEISALISVLLLWVFAILAGLSPSVTRAVTMFSIISLAFYLKRYSNIYNTLAISAFITVLINPKMLFHVGFQMSYLAVIGIVSLQPMFYKIIKTKYVIFDKLWQTFTVTIAAQIGVLPISLYYFHQFPGLFFVSNFVIIPLLGFILGFGIIVIFLSILDSIPRVLVLVYEFIIGSLNDFVSWIAGFESFLLKDIPFDLVLVLSSYVFLIGVFRMFQKPSFKTKSISLLSVIFYIGTITFVEQKSQTESFIIFQKKKHTLIAKKQRKVLKVYSDFESVDDAALHHFKIGEHINSVTQDSLSNVYRFKDSYLLVVDSLGVYKPLSFKPDMVLLRNSPKINLERLIATLNPKAIIADGSNYKTYVSNWRDSCKKTQTPFHSTYSDGAFIISK